MARKEILLLGEERLYDPSEELVQEDRELIQDIVVDLRDAMMDFRATYGVGRGIAAPQIGYFKRLIYLNIEGEERVLINPTLHFPDDEKMIVWDDCMCFPNLLVKVERFKRCRVDYLDQNWGKQSLELEGDLSELIQHEYDHLDGILAVMRAMDNRSLKLKG